MLFINILQIFVCLLLISTILLQARGSGLGSAWGGEAKSYHTKRGLEKILFKFTIGLAVVFVVLSLFSLVS